VVRLKQPNSGLGLYGSCVWTNVELLINVYKCSMMDASSLH
jgi:hypothetical protein